MNNITKYQDFVNESKLQDDYREFFKKLLSLYDVKSPAEFKSKPEKSEEFYADIKKGWSKGHGLTEHGKKLMELDSLDDKTKEEKDEE
jgi:hypothetical protein